MASLVETPYARIPQRKPVGSHTTHNLPIDAAQRFGPLPPSSQSSPPPNHAMNSNTAPPKAHRSLSNATSSSKSSSTSTGIRRSSSNRSNGPPPTSYVALLRKQKATVWCDRSQAEDPRIRIQQRLAKERAEREVAAGPIGGRAAPSSNSSGSFTGGVARKIRHHGGKPVQYTGGNMAGAGVPLRLSATEVDDDADARNSKQEDDLNEWERDPAWGYAGNGRPQHHRRTGSGRSSLGSQRRTGSFAPRFSTASSTPTSNHSPSPSETQLQHLAEETPQPSNRTGSNYFAQPPSQPEGTPSSSGEDNESSRENSFGAMGALPERTKPPVPPKKETTDDLIRRGSVDERTMTMGRSVRLFVANPDLSD